MNFWTFFDNLYTLCTIIIKKSAQKITSFQNPEEVIKLNHENSNLCLLCITTKKVIEKRESFKKSFEFSLGRGFISCVSEVSICKLPSCGEIQLFPLGGGNEEEEIVVAEKRERTRYGDAKKD